jgi:hypothetical protein
MPASTIPSSTTSSQHPFSIETLFGARSPLLNPGLGFLAQLLHPHISENASMMHIGTSDGSESNAGRSVVFIMRGTPGQPIPVNSHSN